MIDKIDKVSKTIIDKDSKSIMDRDSKTIINIIEKIRSFYNIFFIYIKLTMLVKYWNICSWIVVLIPVMGNTRLYYILKIHELNYKVFSLIISLKILFEWRGSQSKATHQIILKLNNLSKCYMFV